MHKIMSSLERMLTTMNHKEPDKVPLFLMVTYHGAKELEMSIEKYFSKSENVVKGQILMRDKYKSDCLNPFYYSAIEVEAFGGEVIFKEDGPPNAGEPIIKKAEDILSLNLPSIKNTKPLLKVLETIENLRKAAGSEVPIIGTVMSPFSLPIMQMGFDKYIELIYEQPELFNALMSINEKFCIEWANAQFAAGATAINYADPMGTPLMIPKELYHKTGFVSAKRVIKNMKGNVAMGFASACCMPILEEVLQMGVKAVTASFFEDIGEVKKKVQNKLTVLGNLSGIEMCNWTTAEAERQVKENIRKAGIGGGFILSDSAGEIPFQVSEAILMAISEAVNQWGRYPLDWIKE